MSMRSPARIITPCVYFITEVPHTNRIKIGHTTNITKRLRTLQTGNPNKLAVFRTIPHPHHRELEKHLHTLLKSRQIRGEWFNLSLPYAYSIYSAYIPSYHPLHVVYKQYAGDVNKH